MKKYKIRFAVFLILACLVIAFMFYNSTRTGAESNQISKGFMSKILALIDPSGTINTEVFHRFIRKAAHFTEFFALGVCLVGMTFAVYDGKNRMFLFFPPFFALLCAVIDEYLQSFTSRSCEVKDVLIDFSGAITGILISLMIGTFARKRKSRNKR